MAFFYFSVKITSFESANLTPASTLAHFMNNIAKIAAEIIKSTSRYFELLFIFNGVILIAIYFSSGISGTDLSYRDIYSRDGIIFSGFGLSSTVEILNEPNERKREEKNKNCILFGMITIMLVIFSFILFMTACFCFEQFITSTV